MKSTHATCFFKLTNLTSEWVLHLFFSNIKKFSRICLQTATEWKPETACEFSIFSSLWTETKINFRSSSPCAFANRLNWLTTNQNLTTNEKLTEKNPKFAAWNLHKPLNSSLQLMTERWGRSRNFSAGTVNSTRSNPLQMVLHQPALQGRKDRHETPSRLRNPPR